MVKTEMANFCLSCPCCNFPSTNEKAIRFDTYSTANAVPLPASIIPMFSDDQEQIKRFTT